MSNPGRMSARFIGRAVGLSTQCVYKMWHEMGLIVKDKYGDWTLTEFGQSIGGKMSNGNHLSVPTFKFDDIVPKMVDYYNANFK